MARYKIFDYSDPMKIRSPKMRDFMEEVHDAIVSHATSTTTTSSTTTSSSTSSSTTTTA